MGRVVGRKPGDVAEPCDQSATNLVHMRRLSGQPRRRHGRALNSASRGWRYIAVSKAGNRDRA